MSKRKPKPKPIPIFVVDATTKEPSALIQTAGKVVTGEGQPTIQWAPGKEPEKK
jgi:hypothetical protein